MVTSAKKIKDKVSALNDDEVSALQELQHSFDSIKHEIGKVIIAKMRLLRKFLFVCFRRVTLCLWEFGTR